MSSNRRSYSRQFDVHRWSDYPEVRQWADEFWELNLATAFANRSRSGRKPKKTAKDMFKVLFLDMYVAWLEDPELSIGISRTAEDYKVGSRYNALFISDKIIEVLDAMLERGFIAQRLGSEESRYRTRIWPLEPLVTYFESAAFEEFHIGTTQKRECIVLNSKEILDQDDLEELEEKPVKGSSSAIEYDERDDPKIIPARELLNDYNRLLNQTHLDVGSQEKPLVVTRHWDRRRKRFKTRKVSLRQHNKFVRRIFYRGDWNLGGRYHGGWWQQIPSELRKHILIDGHQTQEVDFSGFHVSLAYGLEGLEPPTDPYVLDFTADGLTGVEQRRIVKLLALTAINAKDRKTAFMAFRGQINRDTKNKIQGIRFTDDFLTYLLEGFLDQNAPISHYLCTDKGVELMAIDGNITTKLIRHFTYKSVPILTVHDSYIVQFGYEDELIKVMNKACEEELGITGFRIKEEKKLTPRMLQQFQQQDPQGINLIDGYKAVKEQTIVTDGYKKRIDKYTRFKEKYLK